MLVSGCVENGLDEGRSPDWTLRPCFSLSLRLINLTYNFHRFVLCLIFIFTDGRVSHTCFELPIVVYLFFIRIGFPSLVVHTYSCFFEDRTLTVCSTLMALCSSLL
ncbi:hypothetical protein DFJ43DRAFT_694265 [Lentinula guzmanii]|uniref:Uncharacterized protein n=1 Tax=Lentinula guzmanii TaxID=2804957 RepID=A0AA38JUV0_9AGAR|nr:hypothetical protein DFJ43DRAFT_694265 [Lentinula guzmanii]